MSNTHERPLKPLQTPPLLHLKLVRYTRFVRAQLLACALLLPACGPGSLPGSGGDEASETGLEDGATDDGGPADTTATSEAGSDSEGSDELGSESETTDGPEQFCELLAQDCPAGEKCVPDPDGEAPPICVPVLGDGQESSPCSYDPASRTDDCDADSFCWALAGDALSCHAFCDPQLEPSSCMYGSCLHALAPEAAPLSLCVSDCDPLLQNCPAGAGCYRVAMHEFICLPLLGDAGPGEPCEQVQDCAPGNHCMEAEALANCPADKCCAPFCDAWDPNCEAVPGTQCAILEPDPWCRNPLGLCVSPDWPGGC